MSTLAGWWKGEDDTADSIGINNAYWFADPAYDTGVIGKCFKLVNTDVNIQSDSSVSPPRPYHVDTGGTLITEFYLKLTHSIEEPVPFFVRGGPEGNVILYTVLATWVDPGMDSVMSIYAISDFSPGYQLYLFPDILTGWHKFEWEYKDSDWKIYIDDVQLTAEHYDQLSIGTFEEQDCIITFRNYNGFPEPMYVDEIKIYNDSEPIPSNLVGWWKGEDNTVDSITGNDATWATPPISDFEWSGWGSSYNQKVWPDQVNFLPYMYTQPPIYLKDISTGSPTSWRWWAWNYNTGLWNVISTTKNFVWPYSSYMAHWVFPIGSDYVIHYNYGGTNLIIPKIRLTVSNSNGWNTKEYQMAFSFIIEE